MTAQVLFGESVLSFSPETVIYLVRHGETDANANNLVQGSTDVPLNATGREQARAAAEALRCVPFIAAYSSDLVRAKETAAILLEGRGLAAKPDPRVRERHFGVWEGHHISAYLALSDEVKSETTESIEAVRAHAMEALNAYAAAHKGQTVLVVAHGGVIRYVLFPLLGCETTDIKVDNLGYAKLVFNEGVWRVADLHRIESSIPASR